MPIHVLNAIQDLEIVINADTEGEFELRNGSVEFFLMAKDTLYVYPGFVHRGQAAVICNLTN